MKNTFSSVFGCFGRNKRKRIALIQVEYNYKIQNPASEKKKILLVTFATQFPAGNNFLRFI